MAHGITILEADCAMAAALSEASSNGWAVTVCVCDNSGTPIVVRRSTDESYPASYDLAVGKARTAALFRKRTSLLEDAANGGRTALVSIPSSFVLMGGGVPVHSSDGVKGGSGGVCRGAVGVSGVKPEQDEQVALAAAEALKNETPPPLSKL